MDSSAFFEQEFVVSMSLADCFGRLKPSSLMTLIENVAVGHVSDLGYGHDFTTEVLNAAWIVVRTRVTLKRPILYGETVRLRTWAATPKNAYFPRETELYVDGEVVGEVSAVWVLADVDTRKILPPMKFYEVTGFKHRGEPRFEAPERIIPAKECRGEESFRVRYSDLDMNHHVHNTRYLDFAADHLGLENRPDLWVREVNISFAAEVKAGETLLISDAGDDEKRYIRGAGADGKKRFDLELTFAGIGE